jgi:hypothetical protein
VQKVINKVSAILSEHDNDVQFEVGRLIFKKRVNGIIDVFMFAGTIGEDNEDG